MPLILISPKHLIIIKQLEFAVPVAIMTMIIIITMMVMMTKPYGWATY